MKQKTKQRNHGLREVFKELKTLDGSKRVRVEDILTKHGCSSYLFQMAGAIRNKFLVAQTVPYYAWNPKMRQPQNVHQFAETVIAKTLGKSEPRKATKRTSMSKTEAYRKLTEILTACKNAKTFQFMPISQILRDSEIPYAKIMAAPIIKDFLVAGPKGQYKWRDQNVQVPDPAKYYEKVKSYYSKTPKTVTTKTNTPAKKEKAIQVSTPPKSAQPASKPNLRDLIREYKTGKVAEYRKFIQEIKKDFIAEAQNDGVIMLESDFTC